MRGGASATMNYMPGTASLIQDIDSECDRGSVVLQGAKGKTVGGAVLPFVPWVDPFPVSRRETPGPAEGRSDADRLPTQHRSVRYVAGGGEGSNTGSGALMEPTWPCIAIGAQFTIPLHPVL